jgi:hypothetical protein
MAKVSGPLMSMSASGKFGGALVFASRLGQNVVRQLVIPANPMSLLQEGARNIVRVAGAAQRFVNLCVTMGSGRLVTDQVLLTTNAPAGQTWNSYMVKLMTGINASTYTAATAAYALLTAPEKTAWNDAAAGLTPAILLVAQKGAGGVAAADMSAGEVWYHYQYGLYAGGFIAVPAGTPPVYA